MKLKEIADSSAKSVSRMSLGCSGVFVFLLGVIIFLGGSPMLQSFLLVTIASGIINSALLRRGYFNDDGHLYYDGVRHADSTFMTTGLILSVVGLFFFIADLGPITDTSTRAIQAAQLIKVVFYHSGGLLLACSVILWISDYLRQALKKDRHVKPKRIFQHSIYGALEERAAEEDEIPPRVEDLPTKHQQD